MAKILLVEDDLELAKQIISALALEHHLLEHSADGNDALEKLKFFQYDLVILDWNLPGMEGPDVLRRFRDKGAVTPVLMLTGRSDVSEKAFGLNIGADDYLTKPFHLMELSARLKALLRRHGNYSPVLKAQDIELNSSAHQVTKDGAPIKLQPKEFALLEFLMRNPNDVFSVEALQKRIWESDTDASPDTVRVCITRLRNKIDSPDRPSLIRTVPRVGYQICAESDSEKS